MYNMKIKYNKLLTFKIINSLINLIKILYQILEYFLQYPHKYMVKFGRTSLLLFIYFCYLSMWSLHVIYEEISNQGFEKWPERT